MDDNLENIKVALRRRPEGGVLLDLGCADGERTLEFVGAARASSVHGIEITPSHAAAARERGIAVLEADLNDRLTFPDDAFDTVVSNQVIEHLADTDRFVSELRRILRPGGVAVTSTENLASWHNVSALAFGWQPFSLTNVSSTRLGLGNPLAIHRNEGANLKTWEHLRVFAARGLRELFEAHGFRSVELLGAGYYPLPSRVGHVDTRHAAFLTVVASK